MFAICPAATSYWNVFRSYFHGESTAKSKWWWKKKQQTAMEKNCARKKRQWSPVNKSGILKSQGKGFGLPWHLGVNNNLNSIAQTSNKGLNTTYSSSYDLTIYANARCDQSHQGQELVWFGSRLSYYKCMQIWQFRGKKIEKEHEVYKCEGFISLALQTWLHEQWHDSETVKPWRWLKVWKSHGMQPKEFLFGEGCVHGKLHYLPSWGQDKCGKANKSKYFSMLTFVFREVWTLLGKYYSSMIKVGTVPFIYYI